MNNHAIDWLRYLILAAVAIVAAVVVALIALWPFRAAGATDGQILPQGEVVEVEYLRTIDGDTLEVKLDDRAVSVRLFAVDAPELETGTADTFFIAAAVATLLEGAERVWLEFDPAARHDRWGRSLAWVWYEYADPPRFGMLNLEMLHDENFRVDYYPGCQSAFYDEYLP